MRPLLRKNIWFAPEVWDYLRQMGAATGRTPSQTIAAMILKEKQAK